MIKQVHEFQQFYNKYSFMSSAEQVKECFKIAKETKDEFEKYAAYAVVGMACCFYGKIVKDNSTDAVISKNLEILKTASERSVIDLAKWWIYAEAGLELTSVEDGLLEMTFIEPPEEY